MQFSQFNYDTYCILFKLILENLYIIKLAYLPEIYVYSFSSITNKFVLRFSNRIILVHMWYASRKRNTNFLV